MQAIAVQDRPSLSHVQFSISCDLLFGPVIKLVLFPGKFKHLPNRPHGYARSGLRGQVCMGIYIFYGFKYKLGSLSEVTFKKRRQIVPDEIGTHSMSLREKLNVD